MMKKLIAGAMIAAFLITVAPSMASNSINWGANSPMYQNDGTTLLNGSGGDGTADLVQLIYAGSNGVADLVDPSDPQGVGGDDDFAAYSWVGFGRPPASQDGYFNVSDSDAYANDRLNGANYYIRAWDDPSGTSGTGDMPAGSSGFYGNSGIFTVAGNPDGGPFQTDDFYTEEDLVTDMQWVPEPATTMLALLGVCTVIYRRRRMRDK